MELNRKVLLSTMTSVKNLIEAHLVGELKGSHKLEAQVSDVVLNDGEVPEITLTVSVVEKDAKEDKEGLVVADIFKLKLAPRNHALYVEDTQKEENRVALVNMQEESAQDLAISVIKLASYIVSKI